MLLKRSGKEDREAYWQHCRRKWLGKKCFFLLFVIRFYFKFSFSYILKTAAYYAYVFCVWVIEWVYVFEYITSPYLFVSVYNVCNGWKFEITIRINKQTESRVIQPPQSKPIQLYNMCFLYILFFNDHFSIRYFSSEYMHIQ